ncbi:MAG TPA: ABC transporter ATP-binding protein [Solirubrobacteraceae bacterium]|jgi:peptide/nickel transport system ATP-binding protein|nr:ABC transporter ATP-binding protein [Solirubrobacteraceae bacterium]
MSEPILSVEGLRVAFETDAGTVHAVDGISYTVAPGQTLVIVGEPGAGKTVSARAVLGLTRGPATRGGGRVMFAGRDLAALEDGELRQVAGDAIAMTPSEPLSAFHPLYRLGAQLAEAVRAHHAVSPAAARDRAIGLLELVGIPDPHRRIDVYPHQLPPGLRTRAMLALALANGPKVLIADDPTRGLDITAQAQILALLGVVQERLGTAIVYMTRDIAVAAEIADEIAVMYSGRLVERAGTEQIFVAPHHPYTWGLLRSVPHLGIGVAELTPIPGAPPSVIDRPGGCHFHPRCPYAQESHRRIDPQLRPIPGEDGHSVACLLEPKIRRRIWRGLEAGQDPPSLASLASVMPEEEP